MRRAGRRMSKRRLHQLDDETQIETVFSRRDFVRSSALVAAALAASKDVFAASAAGRPPAGEGSAIQLGVASYTFRNFNRAQMIGFLKQLNVLVLNAKDTKDHLPMEPQAEASQGSDEVGARLFNVHMKDLTNFQSKESQVAVGEGIMPVKKIFEALGAIKYKGFVDLEYEIHADDPMPGVIGSFAYMRGVMAGMA